MSKYYIDYENFATRNERIIRAYASGDRNLLKSSGRNKTGDIQLDQDVGRANRLRANHFRKDTKLDNGLGTVIDRYLIAQDRLSKNEKLGLGRKAHATWGERKAARIARNKK